MLGGTGCTNSAFAESPPRSSNSINSNSHNSNSMNSNNSNSNNIISINSNNNSNAPLVFWRAREEASPTREGPFILGKYNPHLAKTSGHMVFHP